MMQSDDTFPSTCWECNATCGSLVTVDNGRPVAVKPNKANPHSKGAFCMKGARALSEWTLHEDRLTQPLRRVGHHFQTVTWDAALDEMADRLAEVRERYGPLSVAGAVSGAFFSRGLIVALLMRSIGSPNWLINQDLCGGCRAVSDMVTGLGITGGEDIDNAECVLVVGRNPYDADPIQWMALRRAEKRGANIIVIDPRRTPAVDHASLWLRPKPGTDAALAMAMMHVLIEEERYDHAFVERWTHGFSELAERVKSYPPAEAARLTGVRAEDIVAAARMYASGPATFVSGHGIDAFSAGVQTFRAFHCLASITGNIDKSGGNRRAKRPPGFRTTFDVLHDPAFRLPADVEARTLGADAFPLWAGARGWQTACHNPTVMNAILTSEPYPVRAMYVSGVNIAVTYPDTSKTLAALDALDFLVVASQTMTPTAARAHLVLPKTTTLEEEEVALQPGGPCVGYTRAVLEPRGEARCDLDIAVALLDRLEARGAVSVNVLPWRTQRELNLYFLGDSGIELSQLEQDGFAEFPYTLGDFESQPFKSPTGKVELYSETLAELGLDPLPGFVQPTADLASANDKTRFPLTLLTGIREKAYHHSRFREQAWLRKRSPHPKLTINPATAAAHGVTDGQPVRIITLDGPGKCSALAEISEDVAPGVVSTGMGWWLPEAQSPEDTSSTVRPTYGALEININAALSYDGRHDPVTGSADTRGVRCRIEPAGA